jgi:hypothetical protein
VNENYYADGRSGAGTAMGCKKLERGINLGTEDSQEVVSAFLEKRKPAWKGREGKGKI